AVIHWEKNDTSADKIICNSIALGSDVTVMVHRLTGAIGMTETDTVFQCTSPPTDVPALDFTYGGGWTSGTIFIDGNDIKITGLVPEPALGVGLLIAVSFVRRRAHVVR
ncbi:MAG TPA: hypothetical protein PLE35_06960, partial [Lentisphaeria bacterium]|nr:hypothetical protein [Lentisphaeria bacterium]